MKLFDLFKSKNKPTNEKWQYEDLEIDYYLDDGTPCYKTKWVNWTENKQIGFLGHKNYSINKQLCSVIGTENSLDFNTALINVIEDKIIYKTKLNNPLKCLISNKGINIINERTSEVDSIVVLNKTGNIIHKKSHNSTIGNIFEFIEDETKLKYALKSGKTFIIDLDSLNL